MKLIFKPALLGLFISLAFAANAWADADPMSIMKSAIDDLNKTIASMQKTISQQNDKINKLESRGPVSTGGGSVEMPPPMSDYEFNERLAGALGGANKWLKDLSFKGDLRLRYEAFQQTSGHPSETDDRNRFRYRLRFGWDKKFTEELKAGFALSSGEAASGQNVDPTSTNTTLDNNFNFKDIFVNKAYASYSPNWAKVGPIKNFGVTAGKFSNPFEKGSSDMIWDRDVTPEGIYETVDFNILDTSDFDLAGYATAGQFILDEDGTLSGASGDSELFAQQMGLNAVFYTPILERPIDFHTAVSYYSYLDYAQGSNFLIGTTSLARGNPNSTGLTTDLDTGDFEVIEIYNELAFYPMGVPVRPFFDWAHNLDNACDGGECLTSQGVNEDNAYAFGVKLGGIVKKGDWEVSYAYKRIEANSVAGAFNDSDFGAGHSGKRGSQVKAGYALTDNITVNAAAFFVNNLNTGTAGLRDEETRRFQTDLVWKFA